MAVTWFLRIDGVDGESTDEAHKGEIDVLSWSWGLVNSGAGGGGGGGGAGKATFQDLTFGARVSKASPTLFLSCATGTHHAFAQLVGVRGGKGKVTYLKYRLTDVLVTAVQQAGTDGLPATEQVSLHYAKVEMTYTPVGANGKALAPIRAGFDVVKNKKF